jgi:8-hydroxy-5-deazaflavin:NADPH oxidoreductase
MKIGIIGVGNIGGTLARRFTAAGHDVRLANSRGPDSLTEVMQETGGIPSTIDDAVKDADAVIVAVPYKAIKQLPAALFVAVPINVAIIDTGNYYPMRDGKIDALDGPITDTQWVAQHFARPVIKAFNSISVNSLRSKGTPSGSQSRIALPVSGDDEQTKRVAFTLVEDAGFTPLDAGPLAESWRQQPGTGAYTTDLGEAYLRKALDSLTPEDRARQPERRESNLRMIVALKEGPGSAESVRALRAQWGLPEQI